MATYHTGIARQQYKLDFNTVHPGQNFQSIDRRQFHLDFKPMALGVSYTDHIDSDFLGLDFVPLTSQKVHEHSLITEASYTILTSRTNPLEPQPYLRIGRGIPQVIV